MDTIYPCNIGGKLSHHYHLKKYLTNLNTLLGIHDSTREAMTEKRLCKSASKIHIPIPIPHKPLVRKMTRVGVNLRTHAKKAEVYEQTQTNERNKLQII